MRTNIKKGTLTRILKVKYFQDRSLKECAKLAGLFINSDFPLNNITTYSQAFLFLDYVQELRGLK